MAGDIIISDEMYHFIKDNTSDYYTMQVILFFGDHPFARFNELAIIHAVDKENGRRFIQEALKILVSAGIIKTAMDGRMTVFSLDESKRGMVTELAMLDTRQQRQLLRSALTKKRKKVNLQPAERIFRGIPNTAGVSNKDATAEKYAVMASLK